MRVPSTIATILALAAALPAVAHAQGTDPARPRRPFVTHPGPNRVTGGDPSTQTNTYGRLPSPRTPTDVGNMAFPEPSLTPAGNLPGVPVGR